MSRPLEELQDDLLQLTAAERVHLVRFLIATLEDTSLDDPAEVDRAWESEIYRRLDRIRSGSATLVPSEDVISKLRNRHG
jgi:putative addiction module component (TIGR02574 family)